MKKWVSHWPLFAAFVFFVYVLLRALNIPLTYDEIWTIESLAGRNLSDIFTYHGLGSNSHLLNSIFVWFVQHKAPSLPLPETLLYRLPNVLAFLLYAWYCIRLMRELSTPVLQIMAFVLCFCNPFLLEFFSLCRGYGMAMAFNTGAFYYLEAYRKAPEKQGRRHEVNTLVFAGFAVLANFSWLNLYLVLLPVMAYLEWIKNRKFSLPFILRMGISSLLLLAIILQPITKLRLGDELWFGGQSGLIYDTFTSLVLGIMGFRTNDLAAHLVLGAILLVLALNFLALFRKRPEKTEFLRSSAWMYLLIFLLLSLSSIAQNFLFRTPFLVERVALVFLLPLLWLILQSCDSSVRQKPWQIASISTTILCIAATMNFLVLANTSYSYTWPFDAKTEEVLQHLNELGEKEQKKIHLDHSWIINVSMRHEKKANKFPWVELIRELPDSVRMQKIDYYYLFNNRREYSGYNAYGSVPDSFFWDTALYYPKLDLLLLKISE